MLYRVISPMKTLQILFFIYSVASLPTGTGNLRDLQRRARDARDAGFRMSDWVNVTPSPPPSSHGATLPIPAAPVVPSGQSSSSSHFHPASSSTTHPERIRMDYLAAGAEPRVAEFEYIGVGVGSFLSNRKIAAEPVDIAGVNFYRCLHNGQACDLSFAEGTWGDYDIRPHLLRPGMHVNRQPFTNKQGLHVEPIGQWWRGRRGGSPTPLYRCESCSGIGTRKVFQHHDCSQKR